MFNKRIDIEMKQLKEDIKNLNNKRWELEDSIDAIENEIIRKEEWLEKLGEEEKILENKFDIFLELYDAYDLYYDSLNIASKDGSFSFHASEGPYNWITGVFDWTNHSDKGFQYWALIAAKWKEFLDIYFEKK